MKTSILVGLFAFAILATAAPPRCFISQQGTNVSVSWTGQVEYGGRAGTYTLQRSPDSGYSWQIVTGFPSTFYPPRNWRYVEPARSNAVFRVVFTPWN